MPLLDGTLKCLLDRYGSARHNTKVSVKEPLTCPKTDLVVTGTFTFNSPDVFENSVKALLRNNNRVNGEFYLDSCINEAINLGYNCKIFAVDHCISWGTPSELRTFDYWKSCFQNGKVIHTRMRNSNSSQKLDYLDLL